MVDPEVWNDVPNQKVLEAVGAADKSEDRDSDGKAEIREKNQIFVLLLVQRAAWQEVVDAAVAILLADTLALWLLLVVVVASHVSEKVHWPANELLADEHGGGVDWRLLEQLVHLVQNVAHAGGVLLASTGNEDHVTLHVASGLVVLAVADFPAEVWHQKGGMAEPTNSVVEHLARREGLVATFVGQHPETRAKATLSEGVEGPQGGSERIRRHVLGRAVRVEEVEGASEESDVPSNVAQSSETRPLVAMLGNGVADVIDGVIWQLKFVAICVHKLS